jgi:glycosyltransferase involved in cell wall biosynthesis
VILFIGPIPTEHNQNVGTVQRVVAIDRSFLKHERVLVQLSSTAFFSLRPKSELRGNLTVYWMNYFLHIPFLLFLAVRARVIYVHTPGVALRVLPLYFLFNVITDFHGVAPEELLLCDRKAVSVLYTYVDRILLSRSWASVFVTESMAKHMRQKYPKNLTKRSYVIPIFAKDFHGPFDTQQTRDLIIYSGGLQRWQCVDLMLSAVANSAATFRYLFLCGDEPQMRAKVAAVLLQSRIEVKSASKKEVRESYLKSMFGFVLREDSVVNRVACPTKLIEYLLCGVIPIVLQPHIGDFHENGYEYLTLDDFLALRIPSPTKLADMRMKNAKLVAELERKSELELERLVTDCVGSVQAQTRQTAKASGA